MAEATGYRTPLLRSESQLDQDFACIISFSPVAVQAHGDVAVFLGKAPIGVPALAFARWSHPTFTSRFDSLGRCAARLNEHFLWNGSQLRRVFVSEAACLPSMKKTETS